LEYHLLILACYERKQHNRIKHLTSLTTTRTLPPAARNHLPRWS